MKKTQSRKPILDIKRQERGRLQHPGNPRHGPRPSQVLQPSTPAPPHDRPPYIPGDTPPPLQHVATKTNGILKKNEPIPGIGQPHGRTTGMS